MSVPNAAQPDKGTPVDTPMKLLLGASALSFYLSCILLPLVGKAGARTEWAMANAVTWAASNASTLLFAIDSIVYARAHQWSWRVGPVASAYILAFMSGLGFFLLLAGAFAS